MQPPKLSSFSYRPIVMIEAETLRPVYASPVDMIPAPYANENYIKMRGNEAHYFYIAISGHSLNEHPGQASLHYAMMARAHILRHQPGPLNIVGWQFARQVLERWGEHIIPWFGVEKFVIPDDGEAPVTVFNADRFVSINLKNGARRVWI